MSAEVATFTKRCVMVLKFKGAARAAAFALFLGLSGLAGPLGATVADVRVEFQSIHGSTFLPVAGMTFEETESTFGPRIQTSTGNYDFHRGIDVDGTTGDNILAVYGGKFYDYRVTASGGNIVILRHELPNAVTWLNGYTSKVFYTWYLHLFDDAGAGMDGTDDIVSGWTKYVDNAAGATVIAAGQHIGEMGNSGNNAEGGAYAAHLHFELRWASNSSLEFQLDNAGPPPTTTQYGFDPHIHPYFLWEPYTYGVSNAGLNYDQEVALEGPVAGGQDITLIYTSNDDMPVLNRLEVSIVDGDDGVTVLKDHVLDFNERSGYDATELNLLDTQDTAFPYMDPVAFGDGSSIYQTNLVTPAGWWNGYAGDLLEVNFIDIWGNTETFQTALVPEPQWSGLLVGLAALGLLAARRRRKGFSSQG